jgi:hypothetical protein
MSIIVDYWSIIHDTMSIVDDTKSKVQTSSIIYDSTLGA